MPQLSTNAASAVGKRTISTRSYSGRIGGGEGKKVRLRQYARQVDAAASRRSASAPRTCPSPASRLRPSCATRSELPGWVLAVLPIPISGGLKRTLQLRRIGGEHDGEPAIRSGVAERRANFGAHGVNSGHR
ncbi:hypothetical protein [uncultured Thiocystis sp.]|uniref:baeRF11 domain-containing protein n=1 Tax=uncultured Thiocystis sp. TaxID=1202134 RepID=UPI0025F6B515|nr:hypothetical protein [uncultured Thiocystis sp.]